MSLLEDKSTDNSELETASLESVVSFESDSEDANFEILVGHGISDEKTAIQDNTRSISQPDLDTSLALVPGNGGDAGLSAYLNHGTGVGLGLWNPALRISANPIDFETELDSKTKCGILGKVILVTIATVSIILCGVPVENVVFEELAIGRALNSYYKGRFFIVSEPPLTLLIYYAFLRLTSTYDGNFSFREIGQVYGDFPYIHLRILSRVLGLLSVYLSYLTLNTFSLDKQFVFLGTLAVLLENSFNTENQYFLSKPIMQFFVVCSFYFWKRSYSYSLDSSLSRPWFTNLFLMAVSLGGAAASRITGTGSLMFVLVTSCYRLWWTFSDSKANIRRVITVYSVHFAVLIVVPLLIFISSWMVHLHLVPNIGRGDYEMSGRFQSSLIGSNQHMVPSDIAYGGFITLRNVKTSGYLHSHDLFYPTKSFQQQTSLYQFKDVNNIWLIEPPAPIIRNDSGVDPWPVSNGDIVRLLHVPTNKRLHSHNVKSHVLERDWSYEVSAYGADGYPGDMNDLWVVEIVDQNRDKQNKIGKWQAIGSAVRFRHVVTGCYLFSHRTRLPSWGEDHFEVTCTTMGKPEYTLWSVETNFHPGFNDSSNVAMVGYHPMSLGEKFLEYTEVIDELSKASSSDGRALESALKWYELPLMPESVKYLVLKELGLQVNLFGNLVNWYMSVLCITGYVLFKLLLLIGLRRDWLVMRRSSYNVRADHEAGHLLTGWLVHFAKIGSESSSNINISDYLPALYFSILFSMVSADWVFKAVPWINTRKLKAIVVFIWGLGIMFSFITYIPLINGTKWDMDTCIKTDFGDWAFQCFIYSEDFQQQYSRPDSVIRKLFNSISEDSDDQLEPIAQETLLGDQIQRAFRPRIDVKNPEVRNIVIDYLRERKLGNEKAFLQIFPELVEENTERLLPTSTNAELESNIRFQWSRVTRPPVIDD
ncbi:dolichyl-phosphate-mannose-protein mannosyltransferase PMT1 [Sugiyamaella lignohabitans]|uniref:Dolichyl-phosphate-mannose--protein mannosyltransferase n=1 Tax=Sugiyamaella lignohabitans TaxID=796027 RepID=A0A167F7V2_9ASCO|nr:dolichyl-phosphate-mannose-protein mannosyltransferase PMT1 [Sugiyamaella lignohabitans]ANB14924.1 dolichyl-phosphate-mannose-protein mannosyltransferase PMT1 [Sugiyamaella lignohabitans]